MTLSPYRQAVSWSFGDRHRVYPVARTLPSQLDSDRFKISHLLQGCARVSPASVRASTLGGGWASRSGRIDISLCWAVGQVFAPMRIAAHVGHLTAAVYPA